MPRCNDLAVLVGVDATRDFAVAPITIRTPLADARLSPSFGTDWTGTHPTRRAGNGRSACKALLPDAAVWHLGLYRNEETAEPVGYYDKLPNSGAPNVALGARPNVGHWRIG